MQRRPHDRPGIALEYRRKNHGYLLSRAGGKPAPAATLPGLNEAIEWQLAQDNYQISTWKDDTILSHFNRYRGTEPKPITAGMADIVSTALHIGAKIGGAMDITIGPLGQPLGFGPEKQPSMTSYQNRSTSGNYRNYYELNGKRISHIITIMSLTASASVTSFRDRQADRSQN